LVIRKSVWMIGFRDELEEVDDINESDLEVWNQVAEKCGGSERFVSRNITAGGHDNIWPTHLVVGCPVPDSEALGAMCNCVVHVEVLEMILLVCDNDVDVVHALETVIRDGKEAVSIWGQVDTDDFWALIGYDIEETWILVSEAVVVLSPYCSGKENIQRGDFGTPFNLETLLNPLAVLVDHRVDDVDERFVAVKKAMSSREDVALKPTFASVFTEDFHHTASERQISTVFILFEIFAHPDLLASFVYLAKFVGLGLVGAEDAKIVHVARHHISKELGHVSHAGKEGDTRFNFLELIISKIGHIERLA